MHVELRTSAGVEDGERAVGVEDAAEEEVVARGVGAGNGQVEAADEDGGSLVVDGHRRVPRRAKNRPEAQEVEADVVAVGAPQQRARVVGVEDLRRDGERARKTVKGHVGVVVVGGGGLVVGDQGDDIGVGGVAGLGDEGEAGGSGLIRGRRRFGGRRLGQGGGGGVGGGGRSGRAGGVLGNGRENRARESNRQAERRRRYATGDNSPYITRSHLLPNVPARVFPTTQ